MVGLRGSELLGIVATVVVVVATVLLLLVGNVKDSGDCDADGVEGGVGNGAEVSFKDWSEGVVVGTGGKGSCGGGWGGRKKVVISEGVESDSFDCEGVGGNGKFGGGGRDDESGADGVVVVEAV
jgi:hypothetical protein